MTKPRFTFFLESGIRATKGKELPLYFNMNYGYTELNPKTGKKKYVPLRMATGFTLTEDEWDREDSTPLTKYRHRIPLKVFMARLEETGDKLLRDYRSLHRIDPHPNELKQLIRAELGMAQGATTSSPNLVDLIDRILKDNESLPPNAKGKFKQLQAKKYRTVRNKLSSWEISLNRRIAVKDFDEASFKDFREFTNEEHKKKTGKSLMLNSMAKDMNVLLTILQKGVKDYGINSKIAEPSALRMSQVDSAKRDTYLTSEMLRSIIETNTLGRAEFENAKNYLIISSFTGLRHQSMVLLHKVSIEDVEYTDLDGTQRKFKGFSVRIGKAETGGKKVEVFVPILEPVSRILEENNWQFPKFPTNQVLNRQLKLFAKYAELYNPELISEFRYGMDEPNEFRQPLHECIASHIGRGSFVTNLRVIDITMELIQPITHPKKPAGVIARVYDKTNNRDRAKSLARQLNIRNHDLYKVADCEHQKSASSTELK
jgi:hypothetical protein